MPITPPTFQFREASGDTKAVLLIHGYKGTGKTTDAFNLIFKEMPEANIYALSFDNKTKRIKEYLFNNTSKIHVIDAIEYFTHAKMKYLESAAMTYDYIMFVLEEIRKKGDCDYVVIDGLETTIEISEMKMRKDNNIGCFQGISNLSIWKDRKLNIRSIHDAALRAAKKGVVYTTYSEKDELVEEGQTVRKRDAPKWIDIIMMETDVVLQCEIQYNKGSAPTFLLHIKTSKMDKYTTGDTIDMTIERKVAVKKEPAIAQTASDRKAEDLLLAV